MFTASISCQSCCSGQDWRVSESRNFVAWVGYIFRSATGCPFIFYLPTSGLLGVTNEYWPNQRQIVYICIKKEICWNIPNGVGARKWAYYLQWRIFCVESTVCLLFAETQPHWRRMRSKSRSHKATWHCQRFCQQVHPQGFWPVIDHPDMFLV